jgi:microcystin-dependent protein
MEAYLGSILICGFNFAPNGTAYCNGQTLAIQQNAALFSLLGTYYGGNGTQNFKLPDLQGRAPIHIGTPSSGGSDRPIGTICGQQNMTMTTSQLPTHTHTIQEVHAGSTVTLSTPTVTVNASDAQGTINKPQHTAYWAKGWDPINSTVLANYTNTKNVTMASDAVQVSLTTTFNAANLTNSAAGQGQPFSMEQPSLALNFVIFMTGIFPSRN